MFAMAVPGLAPLVARSLGALPGVTVQDSGFDGRADVVVFEVARGKRGEVADLSLVEDVFVEVGRTSRTDGDRAASIAGRMWRPERVQRALSVWADEVRPLSTGMSFRVIARVLHERAFLRTQLRQELTEVVALDRPRWRVGDPAQIEVWVSEYAAGKLVAGLRLTDASKRQHEGRTVEREGALRPTVASAMVELAGEPSGLLVDPCCGSGTILREATDASWDAEGLDIDPDAVPIARANAPEAAVRPGDARRLDYADGSVDACVSNLPFGEQYGVQGDMKAWLRTVLGEMARVVRPGGRVVLLAPAIDRAVVPAALRLRERFPIRLLGMRTTIWVYDRP
jgi:SAM-dependent methyltransferase